MILGHQVKEITLPFVVACEGYGDVCFVEALLSHLGITNCAVGCASEKGGTGTGKDAVPNYLKAIHTAALRNPAALKGLAVIADADHDPGASFNSMSAALTAAGFPTPSKPFSIEQPSTRTGIFLLPGNGKTGCLEHLLWEATTVRNAHFAKCIDDFMTCTGGVITEATPNKQAKMKMSALAGATCRRNPWTSAALIWNEPGNPVPIESACFDDVASFLRAFTI